MKFYKIVWGYDAEDMVQIDETELAKAMQCFITKKDGIFKNGPMKGDRIITIQPDYHRVMGWNPGYKLTAEDYGEIGPQVRREHENFLEEAKYQVNQINTPQEPKQLR